MKNLKAFTLVEMLAATAVLLLISGMLFSSYSHMTTTTRMALHKQDQYQDVRLVIRDMAQELHESVSCSELGSNDAFIVENDVVPLEMHWVSIHDNNAGCETVEFHYYYDGSNTLYKACVPRDNDGVYYDVGTRPATWWETPSIGDAKYNPVLENVAGVSVRLFNDNLTEFPTSMPFRVHGNMVPRFTEVTINVLDKDVFKRHNNNAADAIAVGDTNSLRSFVFLARSQVNGY